jgi:hypothetical protein
LASAPEHLENLWRPYRKELERDYVSLSELVRHVQRVHPELRAGETRDLTLRLLDYALRRKEAQAGQFTPEDSAFVVWHEPPEAIVERVTREWNALGDPVPNVGLIMWLRSPR